MNTSFYKKHSPLTRGYLMLLALVFGAIFVTLLFSLTGFVLAQNTAQQQSANEAQAFSLAESGIEYYRWFLSHFPGDAQNGTGSSGPYLFTQKDVSGNTVGTASLALTETTSCGVTTGIGVTAVGAASSTPSVTRTISARYAQPTVALYGEITNDSMQISAERSLAGTFHTNGGIRMDGTSNSFVESALSSWNCTLAYGCSPAQSSATGVVGSGSPQSLWKYPTAQIDFGAIAAQFGTLKTTAQSSGLYYPRVSTGTATTSANYWKGYHLIFNADGTVSIKRVTATDALSVTPLNTLDGAIDHSRIQTESSYETKTLSANCGLIFVEDNVWVEGTIPNKVTIVAANPTSAGLIQPNIYIKDTIQYVTSNGTNGLTAIAANDVLIAADAPYTLTLQGIFVAQSGSFGRNFFMSGSTCNAAYEPRTSISISGTIVSSKKTATKWTGGCGASDAGYRTRTDSYDQLLANNPPAFTPIASPDYQVFDWRQR